MHVPPRLLHGYRAFVDTRLPLEKSRYQKLAETGQRPEVMVICCCDSRVSPEVIFDAHPGELFVVRNVANLVPPYTPTGLIHGVSAALEFAVQILGVTTIMAADAVGTADGATGPAYLSVLEQASVVTTLGNLSTFPEICTRVDEGRLRLVGAYFDVGSGDLSFYNPDTRTFAPVEQAAE
jgi:carbonic anhydrase